MPAMSFLGLQGLREDPVEEGPADRAELLLGLDNA